MFTVRVGADLSRSHTIPTVVVNRIVWTASDAVRAYRRDAGDNRRGRRGSMKCFHVGDSL